jgi:hypothetical protein
MDLENLEKISNKVPSEYLAKRLKDLKIKATLLFGDDLPEKWRLEISR